MFENLFDFGRERTGWEAVGFYVFYAVLPIVVALTSLYVGTTIYTSAPIFILVMGDLLLVSFFLKLLPAVLAYLVLKKKNRLNDLSSYVFILLIIGFGFLAGLLGGMLATAFLTTRKIKTKEEVEKSNTGFKRLISLKGIFFGTIANVIPSDVFSIVFIIILALKMRVAPNSAIALQKLVSEFSLAHPLEYLLINLPGILFSVLGGYVAARIARKYELLNATLTSIYCVVSGGIELFLVHSALVWPMWVNILVVILNIPLATLGGMIYLRTHKSHVRRSVT